MKQLQVNVPAIHVYYDSSLNKPSSINQLLYGMEEEGVPYLMETRTVNSAVEVGYQAAQSSNIGVGVGISRNGDGVVHYNKLPCEKPLFAFQLNSDLGLLRVIGSNAARIVKNIPFIEHLASEVEPNDNDRLKLDIEMIIKEVIERVSVLNVNGGK